MRAFRVCRSHSAVAKQMIMFAVGKMIAAYHYSRISRREPVFCDCSCSSRIQNGKSFVFSLPLRTAARKAHRVVKSHPGESSSFEGNPQIQEQLVRMMQTGVGKERLKEDVRKVVEEESEKLRKVAEQAKQDVDKLEQLMRDRATLEFGSALADINKSADDFEEELRRSRAEMERRRAEFSAWEQQVARQRNQGQFFQGLYEVDADSYRESKKQIPKVDAAQVEVVQQPSVSTAAKQELRNPFRLYIFSSLSLLLAGVVIADLLSKEASLMLDLLYALLGLALFYTAWAERRKWQ